MRRVVTTVLPSFRRRRCRCESRPASAGRPGIVSTSPQKATSQPAPVYARSSRIGSVKPRRRVRPASGSCESESGVFAMQIGQAVEPARVERGDVALRLRRELDAGRAVGAWRDRVELLLDRRVERVERSGACGWSRRLDDGLRERQRAARRPARKPSEISAASAPRSSASRRTASRSARVVVVECVDGDDRLQPSRRTIPMCARGSRRRRRASPSPWCRSAFTVATSTTAAGSRPPIRQTMSTNFSKPMSAPKPLSVTTKSASCSPRRSATSELVPSAMFANGPQWTNAGRPSSVWTRFGFSASFSRTVIAPAASRSLRGHRLAVVRLRDGDRAEPRAQVGEVAATESDRHHLGGGRDVEAGLARHAVLRAAEPDDDRAERAVVHVEAAPPRDRRGSMPSSLPCRRCESSIAASRLFAAPIAWMSPVKWRLISSIGTICARPPPAAPPLAPKTGPSDGSRRQSDGALRRARQSAVGERDRRRRLALAGRRRRDRRDADELSPAHALAALERRRAEPSP